MGMVVIKDLRSRKGPSTAGGEGVEGRALKNIITVAYSELNLAVQSLTVKQAALVV